MSAGSQVVKTATQCAVRWRVSQQVLLGGIMAWIASGLAGTSQAAERIVFLGDSITEAGNGDGGYVALYREQLAASLSDTEVIGAGISGNRVPDLQARLDRDVLSKQPTCVVIYIGINDVWHSQAGRGTSKEDYRAGLVDVISRIRGVGSRVVLCTPSVIGEKTDGSNPLDGMLDEYAQISRDVAQRTGSSLIDLRKAFLDYLRIANPDQKESGILTTDGVHLNPAGNRFVAQEMAAGLAKSSAPLLRHVVLFKFKDGTAEEKIAEIAAAFADLPNKVDSVVGFEWGTNNSPEGLADGFTHCFFVSFATEEGRAAYLPHPAHQEFVNLLKPHLDKVLVVDYWVQ